MATEVITLNVSLQLDNSGLDFLKDIPNLLIDQAVAELHSSTPTIGTSETDVDISAGLTTPGFLIMVNLDPTNFIQWGPKDTSMKLTGRMLAGEPACFRMDQTVTPLTAALRMKADTAPCKLFIGVLNN